MGGAGSTSIITMVIWLVVIGAMMYFLTIRPNKKQREAKELMISRMEAGDTVLTTSGFYGTIIGIEEADNVVIIEFGNNKNCRIATRREAIAEIEKPGEAAAKAAEAKEIAQAEAAKKAEKELKKKNKDRRNKEN